MTEDHAPSCLTYIFPAATCDCDLTLESRIADLERKLADLSRMTLGREVP